MTAQLLIYGILGVASTAYAFYANRRLFQSEAVGPVTTIEGVYYVFGVAALLLGWYFNVRYTHEAGSHASYINYTKAIFDTWASASAAQDLVIVNVAIMPLWVITDGRRRGLQWPVTFFVMSLFTSLAFSIAMYLAFVERQLRYNRSGLAPSSTA